MDRVTKEQRSYIMSKIKSVSMLELRVKPLLKKYGWSLRHQPRGVPGNPDFANKSQRVAIFVHGCFWHRPCPNRCAKMPKTNVPFWRKKFRDNARRHSRAVSELNRMGWTVGVVHECEIDKVYWYLEYWSAV